MANPAHHRALTVASGANRCSHSRYAPLRTVRPTVFVGSLQQRGRIVCQLTCGTFNCDAQSSLQVSYLLALTALGYGFRDVTGNTYCAGNVLI